LNKYGIFCPQEFIEASYIVKWSNENGELIEHSEERYTIYEKTYNKSINYVPFRRRAR